MTTTEKGNAMRVPPSPDGTTPSDRTPEPVRANGGPVRGDAPIVSSECPYPAVMGIRGEHGPEMFGTWTGTVRPSDETITDRAAIRDSDEPDEPRVNGDLLRALCEHAEPAPGATVAALDLDAIEARQEAAPSRSRCVCSWQMAQARHIALTRVEVFALVAEVRRLAEAENDAIRAHDELERKLADSMADADRLLVERDDAREVLRLRSDALARVSREAEALRAQVAAVEAKRDEFADLLARALPAVAVLARVEALGDEWEAMTADVRGTRPEHWRGLDYAEGREAAFEDCAGWLRAALATGEGK